MTQAPRSIAVAPAAVAPARPLGSRRDVEAVAPWLARHRVTVGRPGRHAERLQRTFDVVVVLATAWLTVPIGFVCALLVKVTSPGGPVIFVQRRTGRHGDRIAVRKFRTMVPDADARKADLLALNERTWPDFKITRDPRVTRVGRILRVTSLDELPQLLNVLRGDMSLVGPRPTSFGVETYTLWQTERLESRPGVTGLWQVVARGDAEFADRLRLDVAYLERRSLRLDLEILVRTVGAVLSRKGAV